MNHIIEGVAPDDLKHIAALIKCPDFEGCIPTEQGKRHGCSVVIVREDGSRLAVLIWASTKGIHIKREMMLSEVRPDLRINSGLPDEVHS